MRTDPKVRCYALGKTQWVLMYTQNTRYVVESGARQKDEEWDPEENGGFAIHGR